MQKAFEIFDAGINLWECLVQEKFLWYHFSRNRPKSAKFVKANTQESFFFHVIIIGNWVNHPFLYNVKKLITIS